MRALLRIAGRTALVAYLLLTLVPLLFMVITSFKPSGLAQAVPPAWSFEPTLEHYAALLRGETGASDFSRLLVNSTIVTAGATLLTIALAAPCAYGLTLPGFRRRQAVSMWILSTYMFPPIVAVIPLFILAGRLNLIDSYPVLIVPFTGFALPVAIWIIRGAILELPESIEEAARVDGATSWRIVRQIVLPLTAPAIATAAIITALLSWNEFLFALSLTRSVAKTAPVGVLEFTGLFGTQWGFLTAGSTLIVAPMIAMTLLLRRRLVEGLTFGAVK
jgi:multiple sugar transport system permease protein/sorbitol/mannitol transport system permease protein